MKKIWIFLFVIIWSILPAFAEYGLTFEQFLTSYVNVVIQDDAIPSTYRYIQLKYPNIAQDNPMYTTLQKAVYLDLLPNANIDLPLDKQITQEHAKNIISRVFDVNTHIEKKSLVTVDWLKDIFLDVQKLKVREVTSEQKNNITNDRLFLDVYRRLKYSYLSDSWLDEKELLYGTIKWLVEAANDPYTAFFPPTESHSLTDELQGEYYGIGAYVEMTTPGVLIIVSPIKNSPAEAIGLLWWDRIVKINDTFVDEDISLTAATSIIKWPKGTTVDLKILRDGKLLDFTVTRAKIVINNVESKIYSQNDQNICLVTIAMFDFGIAVDFQKVMTDLSSKKCVKYIFDVRNNPGWWLNEVVRMLNYFVPTGEVSVLIKSKFIVEKIKAWDSDTAKITDLPIRVLINKGSASASEIFAGVIKDYAPKALLVGEKTFGKWSVQELLNYEDGSMLKYTVAKRYMWKSETNINKIGISPDTLLVNKKDTPEDEVLEWALKN